MSSLPIETERLILRKFEVEDAADVLRFGKDPEVTKYTGDAGLISTLDDALKVIRETWHVDYEKYGYGRLAVEVKETGEVIGFCGLKFLEDAGVTDLGYRFLPSYWGMGIATESARAAMIYARETLGLKTIFGHTMIENVASQNVLLKLGFKFQKQSTYDGDDIYIYRSDPYD